MKISIVQRNHKGETVCVKAFLDENDAFEYAKENQKYEVDSNTYYVVSECEIDMTEY